MNGLVSVTGQTGYDDDSWDPSTELRVWTGIGYTSYGWTGDLLKDSPNMAEEMGVADDSLDNTWLDDTYSPAEDAIAQGTGVWIKASGVGTATFVGQVPSSNEVSQDIVAGLNLVAYPWPVEVSLDKISVTGQVGYDDDSWDPTTEIRVWTGIGYTTYGWTGELVKDSPSMAEEMGVTDDSVDNTWLDDTYSPAEDTIPAGAGFWIKATGAGKVVFTK